MPVGAAKTKPLKAADLGTSGFRLDQAWLFKAGDDSDWSAPDFDDGDWAVRHTTLSEGPWDGVGWFRLHLELAPDLQGQALALLVHQIGAAEIYVDGRLQHSLGRVGTRAETEQALHFPALFPLSLQLDPGPRHLIAVRYSNFDAAGQRQLGLAPGFVVHLVGSHLSEDELRRKHAHMQMFFASVALAFGVLHLLLFVFYPRLRENLYYAFHTFCIAIITYLLFQLQVEPLENLVFLRRLLCLPLALTSITGLLFIYSLFNSRLPVQVWAFTALGVGAALWSLDHSIKWVYIFFLLSLLEWLRVVLRAVWKRKPGARIVGLGALTFIGAVAYQLLMQLHIVGGAGPLDYVYLLGVMALLLSMSLNLAWRFGQAHKQLENQLAQVQALSSTLEQKVEERTRELKEAQSLLVMRAKMVSLGELVAGVAHEINTPVGAVRSAVDVLARCAQRIDSQLQGNPAQEALKKTLKLLNDNTRLVGTASDRIDRIVRHLRSFARLDEAELQEVDLHQALDSTVELLQHELKDRIAVIRSYGQVPPIYCYAGELNQVFMNLLINAVQAIPDRGEIELNTSVVDRRVRVAIADSGEGIEPKDIERVFDPGFTTKGVKVGIGLGLSISYNIITKHQGSIEVESTLGKGTTFTVELPLDGVEVPLDQAGSIYEQRSS